MKDNYDFSKGTKNPYFDELKNGYSVVVNYDFTVNSTENEQADEQESSIEPMKKGAVSE